MSIPQFLWWSWHLVTIKVVYGIVTTCLCSGIS
jgi:hypothetical protein